MLSWQQKVVCGNEGSGIIVCMPIIIKLLKKKSYKSEKVRVRNLVSLPLHWGRRKNKLVAFMKIYRKTHGAICTLDKDWSPLSLFHSLAWNAESVKLTSTHSSKQANTWSEKKAVVFLRKLSEWIFLKAPQIPSWVTKCLWLPARRGHRSRKSLALLVPTELLEQKEKLTRKRTKKKYPRLVKILWGVIGSGAKEVALGCFPWFSGRLMSSE